MIDTNQKQEIEFAAFVGIDWADLKHAWALQIPGHRDVERGDLDHTPQAVEAWAAELGRRFGGRPIAVALEQSRGSLLFMLTKYVHLVLFPVHPTTLSDYRKGFRPSVKPSKTSASTRDLRRFGALLTSGWALSFGSPNDFEKPLDS